MDEGDLEYILRESPPTVSTKSFQLISDIDGKTLYFPQKKGKVNVYVVVGGQKGDEAKAKTTALIRRIDPNVGWTLAPNSTHNAGKGVHTLDEEGNPVRLSLHLCPETIVDRDIKNYIGSNTQTNPFSLEQEVTRMRNITGRKQLGIDYHLMLDMRANLVVPTNKADDVINKSNTMGSTISGATSSLKYASAKQAPLVEHVLYDRAQFLKHVNLQIREFNDNIKHDSEFSQLGITDLYSLGVAFNDSAKLEANQRLSALKGKLSQRELDFFTHSDPAQFLLEQSQRVMQSDLFYIGDCRSEIHKHIDGGRSGIIEGVQSSLLSGGVAYSNNRTAANTHGMGIIGDAGLTHEAIEYQKVVVFKCGNTSVGGNDKTMSGFIRQDRLSQLTAISPKTGKEVSFEKTAALEEFLEREEIAEAFTQVDRAFYQAIERGYSLKNSTVYIEAMGKELSLIEARAMLVAYAFGETGETSKRSRICRLDDQNETEAMRNIEGNSVEVRNALDRLVGVEKIPVIVGYAAQKPYGPYSAGQEIKPGMPLLQEHHTVESCIPIIQLLDGCPSLFDDGTSDPAIGKILHPHLVAYLSFVHPNKPILAIGTGKETNAIYCIEKFA